MNYSNLLNELKDSLNIKDDSQDSFLQSIINKVVAIIEGDIGYSLEANEYTDYYSSISSNILFTKAKPITEVLSVKDDDGIEYQVKRFNENAVHLLEPIRGEATINYRAGFTSLPADIETLIFSMSKQYYQDFQSDEPLGIKQKKIDTLSITYFSYSENKEGNDMREQSSYENIISKYRILLPMSI